MKVLHTFFFSLACIQQAVRVEDDWGLANIWLMNEVRHNSGIKFVLPWCKGFEASSKLLTNFSGWWMSKHKYTKHWSTFGRYRHQSHTLLLPQTHVGSVCGENGNENRTVATLRFRTVAWLFFFTPHHRFQKSIKPAYPITSYMNDKKKKKKKTSLKCHSVANFSLQNKLRTTYFWKIHLVSFMNQEQSSCNTGHTLKYL
jgi:hypothetical protein